MTKVLLISANTLRIPYPVYPLGLDYVAGCLDSRYQTKIVDLNDYSYPENLTATIREFSPDFAGVSIRNIDNTDVLNCRSFLPEYQKLVSQIKENSRARIILGGSGFTIFPVEFMQALDADYGIVGEGERLSLLLEALEKNEDVETLPGILTRGKTEIVYEPFEGTIRRWFDPTGPHNRFYLAYGGMLNLQTKRGCPFHCSYCTYPHIEGGRMRFYEPREIARSARELQDAGAKYVFITDSAFNASYEHSVQVAEAFIEEGVSVPWGGFFVPTVPPAGYFKRLAEAGLTHVEFGTESLSNVVIANLRKPFSARDVFVAHREAREAGLHTAHYFLLGGPGENKETLHATLTGIDQLEKAVFFFFCGIRIYPHTALYDIALREGQIDAKANILHPVFYRSSGITVEEIMKMVETHASGRLNWIIGAGEAKAIRILPRLYRRGFT
ncbi:MAG TPA: lipid biosynthesis B12-binding/radical SAM protein, partial [Smithella sp.]|nr:lipid biosynthesis B12-binding/radical SAM protein [Smithella sp.]HQH16890.1 lipid biosynthesis B12-binding/radical SAM protein [Smithella sp.]